MVSNNICKSLVLFTITDNKEKRKKKVLIEHDQYGLFAAKSILCGTAVQEGRGETRKEEDERNGNVYIDETCGMNCITNGMK